MCALKIASVGVLVTLLDSEFYSENSARNKRILGSMQGMFGASVSELYLLVIEDSRSMCDHQKRNTHAYTGTVSQAWL